jgi:hypothetical protein
MTITYVTPGMLAEVRRFFEAALDQTYTRIPLVGLTAGEPPVPLLDDWGHQQTGQGTPVPGLACKLSYGETVVRDEHGAVVVRRPLFWVRHTDPIAVGDLVTDVRDADGRLLLESAAVVRIEASPDRPGAATTVCELAGAESTPIPPPGSP